MPVFTYKGTNRSGGSVAGEMSASNKNELQRCCRRQQITPTQDVGEGQGIQHAHLRRRVNAKELAIFTRQFSVMIDAGLPLVQCLEILAGRSRRTRCSKRS